MNTTKPPYFKFTIAPNALKGSLSASAAADAIERGIKNIFPESIIEKILISDGGDGFINALQAGLSAAIYKVTVRDPNGKNIKASFLYSHTKKIAVIEMAEAAGLALLNESELNPMQASTRGVGDLVNAALDLGAQHIIMGIGGSATSDGGTGLAIELGLQFLDKNNMPLPGNAESLKKINKIDCSQLDPRLKTVKFDVACDVNNLLLGDTGAAAVYGPQKGASPDQIKRIEDGLSHLAKQIKKDLKKEVTEIAGGGAAGGLGAGLYSFLGATLKPGADLLLDILDFDNTVKNSNLLITTEGKLDSQTGFGKAPSVVAKRARSLNVPTIAIAGQIEGENINWQSFGFTHVYSLCNEDIDVDFAISNAATLLTQATQKVIRELMADTLTEAECET